MASLIRLFVEDALSTGANVQLPDDQAHYVNNVMRLNAGDELALFNGRDGEFLARILEGKKKRCLLEVFEKTREQEGCPDLWLVFAPIKKQRMDFIIEKATELGVSCLQPVITRRTIVSRTKSDRLHAQAIEAAEQCERLNIPEVKDELSLEQLMKDWPKERKLFVLNEHGGSQPILRAFEEIAKSGDGNHAHAILSGPEGGFEPSELDLLSKLPFVSPISLGPRILRADTAALSAISCWQSVLGDWLEPLRKRF